MVSPKQAKTKRRTATAERDPTNHDPSLHPRNTFDAFVVGPSNHFAYGAALAVAQAPGKAYNPLFLFGGVGLGKTHLLHAIGHLARGSGARVVCIAAEKFANEYADSDQNGQLVRFREKYRQAEVLLMDEIQYLAGKERIQEEFLHTFNALYENQRQIVLTCDRPATELRNLERRLISRFDGGLVAELQPPDLEMRLAILHKKAQGFGAELPEEIMNLVAKCIRASIRDLEGALIRVASYAKLTGKPLAPEVVEDLLHVESTNAISIDCIQKKVAEHFDLRPEDLASRRRPESIAYARQIAMFISRRLTEASLDAIGAAFGGREHTTVLRACQSVKNRMEVDSRVRHVVSHLEKQLALS